MSVFARLVDKVSELTWTPVEVQSAITSSREELLISNHLVPLPDGVRYTPDFVSAEEEEQLLGEINARAYMREGFEQLRNVQMYNLGTTNGEASVDSMLPPKSLIALRDRLAESTGLHTDMVTIEEIGADKWYKSGEFSSQYTATTFASRQLCPICTSSSQHSENECQCFVAHVPLGNKALQHWNRPASRQVNCWNLKSTNHWTDLQIERRSLLVRTDECMWEWRCRTTAVADKKDKDGGVVVVVKFYKLPEMTHSKETEAERDNFGYIPHPDDGLRKLQPRPPLEQLLTIVVTTSPIQSHPSTELLERAMETFIHCGPTFAYRCRKVIVCDGYRAKDDDATVSRKYVNAKQSMRNGIVNNTQADNYRQFKQALRKLCEEAADNTTFQNTVVEELPERHGYGFALRHAVTHCVSTPFVCVIQHDRTFMRTTPMDETLTAMWNHPNIKYVGMSMRSNLMCRDNFLGKYGKAHLSQFNQATLRPKELWLDAKEYGPNSASAATMGKSVTPKVLKGIHNYAEAYRTSVQNVEYLEWCQERTIPAGRHVLSLTPTLFWYDNIHVVETKHYRDFCFNPSYKMVARGGFVEDKLSPVLVRTVERLGLLRGHARYGCFLLDDHSGLYFTGHLDGGSYRTNVQRQAFKQKLQPQEGL